MARADESLDTKITAEVEYIMSNADLSKIDSFSEVVDGLTSIEFLISNEYFKKLVFGGMIDGTNKDFNLIKTIKYGSESVYYNGLLQEAGVDYTISMSGTISFTDAPKLGTKVIVYGVAN